jgi:hypothetical protein
MSERGLDLPIACNLTGPRFVARREEIIGLLRQSTRTERLEDGYAFEFDGTARRARQLVDFISAERSCCQFFLFELVFEPGEGSVWLRVRGPEGAGEFVRQELLSGPV